MIPPNFTKFVEQGGRPPFQRNTSRTDFTLRRQPVSSGCSPEFELSVEDGTAPHIIEAMAKHATVCVLKEGETLFIPRGWWHRAENVWIGDRKLDGDEAIMAGWTAGVGWWFRFNALSRCRT
jgi:Cupin-like domain